jgi:hypothetical protein
MKKQLQFIQLIALGIVNSAIVFANYTGTYGKLDNVEIGMDMSVDFFQNLLPYAFYLLLAVLVAFGILKLRSWLDSI